jgi:hypothetical protein
LQQVVIGLHSYPGRHCPQALVQVTGLAQETATSQPFTQFAGLAHFAGAQQVEGQQLSQQGGLMSEHWRW